MEGKTLWRNFHSVLFHELFQHELFQYVDGHNKISLLYIVEFRSEFRRSTMSSPSPEPQETTHKAKVISTVTHYTLVAVPGASGGAKSKTKPKTKKETETKEFTYTFEASLSNYLDFLKLILAKHGEERYNITAKMLYSMKVQLAGIKCVSSCPGPTRFEGITGRPKPWMLILLKNIRSWSRTISSQRRL
jgi:hypothetical protein